MSEVLIVGAGIGGLSAAIALGTSGEVKHRVSVVEKSSVLSDVGAGIQLGPNSTTILIRWGLGQELSECAFEPEKLQVMSALSGVELGSMNLGSSFRKKYGAPYFTLHRADLHKMLYSRVLKQGSAVIELNKELNHFKQIQQGVEVEFVSGSKNHQTVFTNEQNRKSFDVLIGADGVWSRVRSILNDMSTKNLAYSESKQDLFKPAEFCGDLAYRSLVSQKTLPKKLRFNSVRVWLGPKMHLVQYPIRGGEWLNSVLFIDTRKLKNNSQYLCYSQPNSNLLSWDIKLDQTQLGLFFQETINQCCPEIMDTISALGQWQAWPIMAKAPLRSELQMVAGRVALLGDAAHPMLPYLAQGAGMSIEDADSLGRQFSSLSEQDSRTILSAYAQLRWRRNAWVQQRALLNQKVFHAEGLLAVARNSSLRLFGDKLLSMPWLYGHKNM
jgi:salicylate hydroxylase